MSLTKEWYRNSSTIGQKVSLKGVIFQILFPDASIVQSMRVAPPKILEATLKQLLTICTKEAPFQHVDGSFFQQIDSIAMGSSLGCVFVTSTWLRLKSNL